MKTARTKIRMLTIGLTLTMLALTLYAILDAEHPAVAAMLGQDETAPATVDPGPGTSHIGPELWGTLQKQSVGGQVPVNVTVEIYTDSAVTLAKTLGNHVSEAGGRNIEGNTWEVPTAKALEIVHRSDVAYAALAQAESTVSPQLNETLNSILAAVAEGIPGADAVQYAVYTNNDRVLAVVSAPDVATATSVRKWLHEQKVYVRGNDGPKFGVLLPVGKIQPLIANFTTINLHTDGVSSQGLTMGRSSWSKETQDFVAGIVKGFLPSDSTFLSGSVAPPTPSTSEAEIMKARNDRIKNLHNVQQWHHAGFKGKEVTVGIIDWGYAEYNAVPDLDDLSKTTSRTNSSASINAFCQSVMRGSVVADSVTLFDNDLTEDCEPYTGLFQSSIATPVSHGVHIAELVNQMAPEADLLLAQANGPMQVYDAARWLKSRGADVIVHAGGWHFDGPGNGTSPLTTDMYTGDTSGNEHSPHRYYPSPLNTVDEIIDDDGPVWINAAGNQERRTMWFQNPQIIDDPGNTYDGYVIFDSDPSNKDNADRTCQEFHTMGPSANYHSMRWGDKWPVATFDLDYRINRKGWGLSRFGEYDNSAAGGKKQYDDDGAHSNNFAVRRTSESSINNLATFCLRIFSNPVGGTRPVAPNWIQFQILTSASVKSAGPTWEEARVDTSGRSMVPPAESHHEAVLAIGAFDMDGLVLVPTNYSSSGPIFGDDVAGDGDFRNIIPDSVKPDLITTTGGATYTNWRRACNRSAANCDGLHFQGASGATAHTGGIAAMVVQLFEDLEVDYTPEDVANFLRDTAWDAGDSGADDVWGGGFLWLPCAPSGLGTSLPYREYSQNWSSGDCTSRQVDRNRAKSDYYIFKLDETHEVTITLSSTDSDSYLYLYEGPHYQGVLKDHDDNGSDDARNKDAEIKITLHAGIYTVEATTEDVNSSGFYSLEITGDRVTSSADTTYLSPDPSSRDFRTNKQWHGFQVVSNERVNVIVNPTGAKKRMEIHTTDPKQTYCGAEQDDKKSRYNGNSIYFEGCVTGIAVVEIRSYATDKLLKTYDVRIRGGITE